MVAGRVSRRGRHKTIRNEFRQIDVAATSNAACEPSRASRLDKKTAPLAPPRSVPALGLSRTRFSLRNVLCVHTSAAILAEGHRDFSFEPLHRFLPLSRSAIITERGRAIAAVIAERRRKRKIKREKKEKETNEPERRRALIGEI